MDQNTKVAIEDPRAEIKRMRIKAIVLSVFPIVAFVAVITNLLSFDIPYGVGHGNQPYSVRAAAFALGLSILLLPRAFKLVRSGYDAAWFKVVIGIIIAACLLSIAYVGYYLFIDLNMFTRK